MSVEGVDYAFSRPNISQLAALGTKFACRYGGQGSTTKHLTPDEAAALSAAGIAIVANVEGAADGLLGGWNAGVSWARSAESHFARCGMPAGRPIYLSVDFNVSSVQWPTVAKALQGAASVLGAARVGIYGGRRAIEWARRDGVAAWYWQTYAWSSGIWIAGNHIEQYLNGVTVAGGTLDLDRALPSDYGQWNVGGGDMLTQREQAILSNAYQVLYEQTHEHDPIRFITDLDHLELGASATLPNLPLRRMMRVEAKLDQLIAMVAAIGTANPDIAALIASMKAEFEEQMQEIEAQFSQQMLEIESTVDRELDEAFRGGADNDAPA